MKSILLSSVAAFAFAGAAAAEVTFSGEATLEYNDNTGFDSDLGIDINLSQELDNGLTASASIAVDDLLDGSIDDNDFTLSLTSDTAGLHFGNTDQAAQTHWVSAGDMAGDGFSETDTEVVLRGDVTFGSVDASVSYLIDEVDGDMDQLSVGASADLGSVSIALAYQAAEADYNSAFSSADFNGDDVLGLSVGTSLGGADLRLAYATDGTEKSTGVSVSYPVGPVTLGAAYVLESGPAADYWEITAGYADGPISVDAAFDSTDDWSLEGSYDVGNGLTVFAGLVDAGDDYYLGTSYDLGSGAEFYVSYVEDGGAANADNEIGANDYARGTTVGVSFEF